MTPLEALIELAKEHTDGEFRIFRHHTGVWHVELGDTDLRGYLAEGKSLAAVVCRIVGMIKRNTKKATA